jgi:hypothetical protein
MKLAPTLLSALAGLVVVSPVLAVPAEPHRRSGAIEKLECDVAILGGGAAGAYAAVRLRDMGNKVIVIEKKSHLVSIPMDCHLFLDRDLVLGSVLGSPLSTYQESRLMIPQGGHVDTYSPPGSPVALDYGVIAYLELPGVRDFFGRFGIDLISASSPNYTEALVDFDTGAPITSGNTVNAGLNATATAIALGTYGQLAAEYANYTFPSLIQLPAAPAFPPDLALPFGEFVQKYNLQAAVPIISQFVNYVGDVLAEPTAYIMTLFGAVQLNATANGGLLIPTTYNNSVLYERIAEQLGPDVLLSSTLTGAKRNGTTVELTVSADNCTKNISAKKLLVTAPPLAKTLAPLGLDAYEESVFTQWRYQSAYVGVLANTGLPDNLEILNADPDSSPNVLNLPGSDGTNYVASFTYSEFPGLYRTSVIGGPSLSSSGAKALVTDALAHVAGNASAHAQFVAFASHTPLEVRATAQGISSGFYQQAFGLNGHLNTFYTGAAWASDWTSVQWLYLEEVILPLIAQSLQS